MNSEGVSDSMNVAITRYDHVVFDEANPLRTAADGVADLALRALEGDTVPANSIAECVLRSLIAHPSIKIEE